MVFDHIDTFYDIPSTPQNLYAPIVYAMESGGKHLRPVMAAQLYRIFGGRDEKTIGSVVYAIELFHNFTLIHDDLMDNADTRRGIPTIFKKWGANTAVLSGDRLLILAYECLCDISSVSASDRITLLHHFNHMATKICEGQQEDDDIAHNRDASMEDYMHMIYNKTAVLFGFAFWLGAFLTHTLTPEMLDLSYELGIQIGITFQLQDDLLDIFGNDASFGKRIGGDIRQRKKTFPFFLAQQTATDELRFKLNDIFQSKLPDRTRIEKVSEIYHQCNIKNIGDNRINKYFVDIKEKLQALPQNIYRDELEKTIRDLVNRTA